MPAVINVGKSSCTPVPTQQSTSSRNGECGAEMLEFAFAFAILMMLLLGIFEFARAYNVYQTITRAAREGVRMAVLPSSVYDQSQGQNQYIDNNQTYATPDSPIFNDYIRPALLASGINPGLVSNYQEKVDVLDPTVPSSQQQCGILISFDYPFQLNVPFTSLGLATIPIGTQVQMRLENQPASGSCP